MTLPRVFLCGGDNVGWALDDDLAQIRRALHGQVEFTNLHDCEIIHSVYWETLLDLDESDLEKKKVICHLSGEPARYMRDPRFLRARQIVGKWVSQSSQAQDQWSAFGYSSTLIPYAVDVELFKPISPDAEEIRELRKQYGIPEDRYLIGNFHRDTEGGDLYSPKRVKGPDVFAEIVALLHQRGVPLHVVLAGPRRFWLRRQLAGYNIPFTYVGEVVDVDDLHINRLSRSILNLLYNLIDIYVCSSRSEGGPRSLLEAAAARCKVVSTPVGIAADLLNDSCLFKNPVAGAELIERDYRTHFLNKTVESQWQAVLKSHVVQANTPLFTDLYRQLNCIPAFTPTTGEPPPFSTKRSSLWQRLKERFAKAGVKGKFTVGLWHNFFPPPYGGGNQFMLALRKGLVEKKVTVSENKFSSAIDAYVLNSVQFDLMRFIKFCKNHSAHVLHRIDGPIYLIRGFDREKDEECFEINRKYASATVIQSNWTYQRIVEMGYTPVSPVIVQNSVNADIFHSQGRVPFDPTQKIKLISSCWSDNPRKGGAVYKWIEDNLDWERFDYTFVGRASEKFTKIKQIEPLPSEKLAELLRQHHIFITASQNDPCSNAVIEALACGLPVLYLNDGGHPELVGQGGLPFDDEREILSQLDLLVDNYELFQRLIFVPPLEEVAESYLSLLREITLNG